MSDEKAADQELAKALATRTEGIASRSASAAHALGTTRLETILPPTPLRGAAGLACRNRALLVAEPLADRISEVKPDGTVLHIAMPPGLTDPRALSVDDQGSLLVATGDTGALWRGSADGSWQRLPVEIADASGIAPVAGGSSVLATQCAQSGRLVELDGKSMRVRAQKLGCPGAFVVDPDGTAVVPLSDRGEVVAVSSSGEVRTLAKNLQAPSVVARAPGGGNIVAEGASGTIGALPRDASGAVSARLETQARLAPGLAGLVTCGETLAVSSSATGSIEAFKPFPGAGRVLVPGGLVSAGGIAFDGDDVLIADTVSIKRVRGNAIELVLVASVEGVRSLVGLTGGLPGIVWATSPEEGEVLQIDVARRQVSRVATGLDWPTSIVRTLQGDLIVAETGSGRVLRIGVSGVPETIASGLLSPVGLAIRGEEILTAEPEGGRVLALREGDSPTVALSTLSGPAGIAIGPEGKLYVAERGSGRLVRKGSGGAIGVAGGLALGDRESLHPLPVAMIVAPDGSVLVASAEDGSVLRIIPD